ncbi:endonuclease/exonuclease/phosphatase family protein [Actinophytocola oryzae]|uniref:Endonuclease/exonuclease/phosphatase family metal-dependent hydrolase n=1 Tax=Actinophytocola oryzae TaxID=502181 RepID=A0A4R7UUU2_9PSEU|nr:endonuclease/exonuclease/phosphatase family protein [Actinophytocola oryzae]TDV39777.1 endonuclease/exonuclease/phosphatase family metal-dependent hydrolase [Actinophytocola oryzae]
MRIAAAVLAVLVAAGCSTATGSSARPTRPAPDELVRVVDLNAAMGYRAGPGDPGGTDATRADFTLLADDIVRQNGDIANLQEMALPGAEELRSILREKTGNEWQLNWAHVVPATFYAGRSRTERPTYDEVSSGNAQLIRIGDGITAQRPITVDGANDDQGIVLPSGARAFSGVEVTTAWGVVDVYNTHLALARQVPDPRRAEDVRRIQQATESRRNPTVVTGDFNQTIDIPDPSAQTMAAIRAFTDQFGYTDVTKGKGPTIDQKHPKQDSRRIDYILVRGVRTTATVRFVSHESDHWGLATTIEQG